MMIDYTDIVLNSFLAHLAMPTGPETFVYALAAFEQEGLLPAAAVAWLAAMTAYAVNFGVGRLVDKIRIDTGNSQYEKAQTFFRRWLIWGLLLAGQPFVSVLPLAAGIFAIPWHRVLLLSIIGHALRYGWLFVS